MFMPFDPIYLMFMIPALILAGIASAKTKGTFDKYTPKNERTDPHEMSRE